MCSRVWTTCTRVFWLYIRNVHMFTVTAHTPVHLHCVWSHRLCSHRFSVWTNEDWTTRWHKVWSDVGLTAVLYLSSLLLTSYLGCFLSFGAADDVGSGLVQTWTLLKLQNNSCWINPLTKKQKITPVSVFQISYSRTESVQDWCSTSTCCGRKHVF